MSSNLVSNNSIVGNTWVVFSNIAMYESHYLSRNVCEIDTKCLGKYLNLPNQL